MNLKETYNKIAEDWFKDHRDDMWWMKGATSLLSFLEEGNLILDIGCGPGLAAKYMIKHGMKVVGIDFSEKMIEIAKREVPEGKFLVMDAKNLNSLEGNFDGIFAKAILLHVSKKEVRDILGNWTDKLKNGGYMYIAVKEKKPTQKEEELVTEHDYGSPYERFFSYFSREEMRNYIKDVGMQICWENSQWGAIPWVEIVAQKK